MTEPKLTPPNAAWPHQGNLLNPAVRRDIADLNRLFLAHALDPGHGADRWFQLPAATVTRLVEVTAGGPGACRAAARSRCSSSRCRADDERAALAARVRRGRATLAVRRSRAWRDPSLVRPGGARRGAAARRGRAVLVAHRVRAGVRHARRGCPRCRPSESFRLASWPGSGPSALARASRASGACWPTLRPAPCSETLHWAYSARAVPARALRARAGRRAPRASAPCAPGHRRGSRRRRPTFLADEVPAHYPALPSRDRPFPP